VCGIGATAPHLSLPALMQRLQEKGLTLPRLTTRHASLEDMSVTLTGRKLRDDEPVESK
jgi:ABC-2 type transport system ATP-binding protein